MGKKTLIAAREVKDQLAKAAADKFKAQKEDIVFKDKMVFVKGSPGRAVPFKELVKIAQDSGPGSLIMGKGYWSPTKQ